MAGGKREIGMVLYKSETARALKKAKGDLTNAAEILGIPYMSVAARVHRYGLRYLIKHRKTTGNKYDWDKLRKKYEKSKMTIADFCRKYGYNKGTVAPKARNSNWDIFYKVPKYNRSQSRRSDPPRVKLSLLPRARIEKILAAHGKIVIQSMRRQFIQEIKLNQLAAQSSRGVTPKYNVLTGS